MNKKLEKNKDKQEKLKKKREEIDRQLSRLEEEQEEMENWEVIQSFRSRHISLDEFLALVSGQEKEKVFSHSKEEWEDQKEEEQ